jgi:hypothetical protein
MAIAIVKRSLGDYASNNVAIPSDFIAISHRARKDRMTTRLRIVLAERHDSDKHYKRGKNGKKQPENG